MEDKTKHVIAHTIYIVCKMLAREFRFVQKPLLLGIIIWIIFSTIAEWSDVIFGYNCKEPYMTLGSIGFFLPTIVKYYQRVRAWVLKWK